MLVIFYQTLDDKVPKWQNSNGIIGSNPGKIHYCLVSLMWMKIGSNDITAQVPGVS
jgi:hypothetical protein